MVFYFLLSDDVSARISILISWHAVMLRMKSFSSKVEMEFPL